MMSIRSRRGLKALAASLPLALGMTACSPDYVADYLYVTAAGSGAAAQTSGLIFAYAVDSQTGAISQLADSGIGTGGGSPVTIVATPNSKFLYVPNQTNSTVTPFAVGTDGKIYPQAQASVVSGANGAVGSLPTAAAVDRTGNFLYVTFADTNLSLTGNPGPGGVAIFPINQTNGTLGSPLGVRPGSALPYVPVGNNPAGVAASSLFPSTDGKTMTQYFYVIDQETPANATAFGVLLGFMQVTPITSGAPNGPFVLDTANTVITPIPGPVAGGFAVGTTPSSVTIDPLGFYLYATDSTTNQIYSFKLGSLGSLLQLPSSPSATGDFPVSVVVDPSNNFVYVANFGSASLSAYTINRSNGSLSSTAGSLGPTDNGPNCVAIDPALGIYVYTANKIGNNVSALQLDLHTGALKQVQGTKFAAGPLPSCAVLVPHGSHATQRVQ